MRYWLGAVARFLVGYGELASIYAGILAYELIVGRPLAADTKWGLFAGAFLAMTFWNWHKATKAAPVAEPKERVFADHPELLLAHFTQSGRLTWTQRITYIDQWMLVSGDVDGSADALTGDAIYLSIILENDKRVNLSFSGGQREAARALRKGQTVTAICQVKPSAFGVGLENCEVVKAAGERRTLARVS